MGEALYALIGSDPDFPYDRDAARKGAVLLAEKLIEIAAYSKGTFQAITSKKPRGKK